MLDITFIRENLDLCKQAAVNKRREVNWDELLRLDDQRRRLIQQSEKLRQERNEVAGKAASDVALRDRARTIKEELKGIEAELTETETKFEQHMLTVPNVPDPSVPVGPDESANVVVKTWGTIPTFTFPIKNHVDIVNEHDLVDFERGTKVGGFRAYFLKNEGALLHVAALLYAYQLLVSKGYTPLVAPALARAFAFEGIGQFPWSRDEVYELPKDDLFLSGTAEVAATAYYANEILKEEDLPKKMVAISPCYRREAGSYGKDTKGIYRVHEFMKVEQVIITTADTEKSLTLHQELLANSESILQGLQLPYRVLLMCTGDMGEPQIKKYDLETWMPGREAYGETMSNSFMGDFQARRLKIRYRKKDGQVAVCHTLNNTALASPRMLIPLLENYQQADGSIKIPDVLVPYVGKKEIRRSA